MEKTITLLGSTGSVGRQTLQVVRHLGGRVRVCGLAAKSNIDLLESQAREFQPEWIAVYDEKAARELKKRLPNFNILVGLEGLCEVASLESAQLAIFAMGGTEGFLPTVYAIRAKKDIAIANKEVIVAAGKLLNSLIDEHGVTMFPIDSEHSAIFQCLRGEKIEEVRRLILTASGGPFLKLPKEELKAISYAQAANHPTWRMGAKVSVDCSNLMNKGFEVIEASHLFRIPADKVEVVIHPQSIVHSFVEFIDGSIKAVASLPSMELPIQYAVTFPERCERREKPFDFTQYGRWDFSMPDKERFPCLALAYEALETGGSSPCVLNAANEVLVERFGRGEVSFLDIEQKLSTIVKKHKAIQDLTIDTILEVDRETRIEAAAL
jgi:1-deoxy-D-xylulose-5-phosphate reductoisomerase